MLGLPPVSVGNSVICVQYRDHTYSHREDFIFPAKRLEA